MAPKRSSASVDAVHPIQTSRLPDSWSDWEPQRESAACETTASHSTRPAADGIEKRRPAFDADIYESYLLDELRSDCVIAVDTFWTPTVQKVSTKCPRKN